MAFLETGWAKVSVSLNQPIQTLESGVVVGAPTFYSYQSSTDAIATIGANDYFSAKVHELCEGDVIFCTGSDASEHRSVTNLVVATSEVDTSALAVTGAVGTANLDALAVTTAKIAADAVTYDKIDPGVIQTAIVTVSTGELLALAAAPKTLVAAPGATLANIFVDATLFLDYNSAAYVDGGYNLAIRYTDGAGVIVSEAIEATGFADATADTVQRAVPKKDAIVSAAASLNQALVLDNTGAGEWTTGNSPIIVKIRYYVTDYDAAFA